MRTSRPVCRGATVFLPTVTLVLTALWMSPSQAAAEGTDPSAEPPSVALFGDSIAHSAEPEVRSALGDRPVVAYDAANATTTSDHLEAVTATVSGPSPPSIVAIELGTNDAVLIDAASFEQDVRQMLDVAAPRVACIRWLDSNTNTAVPATNAASRTFNRILRRVVAEYDNVEVMHYSLWASLAGPSFFLGDGLHPSASGRVEFGALVRQAVDGCDPSLSSGPFWDVLDRSVESEAVRWLGTSGVETGRQNRTFGGRIASQRPIITRGDWMTWLWRMAGSPTGEPAGWVDVTGSTAAAADWAVAAGVTTPPAHARFRPTEPLTRHALAKFLWRFAGSPVSGPSNPWVDVHPGGRAAVDWVTEQHLLRGSTDLYFRPTVGVRRTAAAQITHLFSLLGLAAPTPRAAAVPPATPAPPTTALSPETSTPPLSVAPPTTATVVAAVPVDQPQE